MARIPTTRPSKQAESEPKREKVDMAPTPRPKSPATKPRVKDDLKASKEEGKGKDGDSKEDKEDGKGKEKVKAKGKGLLIISYILALSPRKESTGKKRQSYCRQIS